MPEVADHLAHIMEMECDECKPSKGTNTLYDMFSEDVDKGHAYLTEPKVVLVDPAVEIEKRKKPAPAKKKPVTPKKVTPKAPEKVTPKVPETPTQITRSGRAVKANRRFIDDMETGSSDEEEPTIRTVPPAIREEEDSEEEFKEGEEEEDTDEPVKRGRGRPSKKQPAGSKKGGRKESPDEVVIGSITVMEGNTSKGKKGTRRQSVEDASEERRSTRGQIKENEESKKRTTRGSATKKEDPAEMYRVKGKPQIIRKGKAPEKETPNSRKRTHSEVEEDKAINATTKKSKGSDAIDRITKKGEAKDKKEKDEDKEEKDNKEDEEDEEEEEEDEEKKSSGRPISKKSIEKIDPYSPDFSVKNFATWITEGKKENKGWKKASDSPKSTEKKSPGRGWIKITNSDFSKEEQEEIPEEDYVEEEVVVPTFKCDQCGQEFKRKESLQEHRRVKHKVPLTCEHCGNRFVSKQSLASHMLTHTGGSDKPYSCGVCGARFTQKSHIGPHMLTHTGEKTFTCQYCFTKFKQKSAMTEHIKRMHPADTDGPKPHMCKLCPIGFWSSGALQHHMKVAHSGDKSGASSPSRPKSPPKKEIVLPPPAEPQEVNLFIGVYECSLCAEKFEEMMDLADHVKTHMTPLEEEEEMKNAQIAEAARAQAIEREQMLLRELEEANRRAAERAAAGEEESKDQLDISDLINRPKGVPIKIPPGITDIKTGPFRGYSTPKAATSTKVPLENVVISTPSGLKFTIKASPQLKGSKYKLAALPLKGLSGLGQHLKSGVLKLAPTTGSGSAKYGVKSSPQQIKMKILGGEGDGSVIMSSTNPQDSSMQGTVLDLKDITKTAADMSGVPAHPAEDVLNIPPKLEPPPQPAQPTDQTYYQCGDCSALFETMEAIQAHLQNDCNAAANQAAAAAQASAAAAANVAAVPPGSMVDNLGSIPSVDASEMTGTTTIDLGQPVVPGTSLITENGTVITGANIGENGVIGTDPTNTVSMSSIAFDAGLQVMATAAGMTSLAPTTLEDPNQAVATPDDSELTPEQTGTDSAAIDSEHSEHASVVEPGVSDSPVLSMEDPDTAGGGSVDEANSEIAVSEASAELAQDTEPAAGDAEATGETAALEENPADETAEAPLEMNQDGSEEQAMETNETQPSPEEMLTMPEAEDSAEVPEGETLPATSGDNIVVTQILNIPGMDTTQSVMQSIPATTAPYEGRKMISILNQPGVVQTPNGEGDALVTQDTGVIGEGSNGNFENVVLDQGEEDSIAQPQEQGEQLTLVDQTQAVTLPDGQQIVTYIDEGGQLAGNGNQQIQVVTTESGETYQIALPEGGVQGPMQYVTEDGQILTFKGSDLANQGEYMVVDNGNLGGVPVTQTSDNVQYVVYTSSS